MAKQNSSNQGDAGTGGQIGELRDRASTAVSEFGNSTSDQIDNSPLIAVAGGIAIGAVLAAVLPASQRERELLQPVGSKLNSASREAIDRVRETGKAKVDELAGDKVREFFGVGATGSGSSNTSA